MTGTDKPAVSLLANLKSAKPHLTETNWPHNGIKVIENQLSY